MVDIFGSNTQCAGENIKNAAAILQMYLLVLKERLTTNRIN